MPKSKLITDYVPVEIARLRIGQPTPFDLHLYFQANAHVLLWQPEGTLFTREMLKKCKERGLGQVWVHKGESERLFKYLDGEEEFAHPKRFKSNASLPSELTYKTITGENLYELIHDGNKSEREKRALIAKASRNLLGELASATSIEEQKTLNISISKVIQDLLSLTPFQARSLARQIWSISSTQGEMSHGVNVATLAVLFSMAFGRIEEDILGDVGMAGLLHDVGLTLLPLSLSQTPWSCLSTEQMADFACHESSTSALLSEFGPAMPERVRQLVAHHHGRYSATRKTKSVAEIAQLIAMADTLDAMCNGLWDGSERTLLESLLFLENQEIEAKENRLFNEDVFSAVIRWIRNFNRLGDTLVSGMETDCA